MNDSQRNNPFESAGRLAGGPDTSCRGPNPRGRGHIRTPGKRARMWQLLGSVLLLLVGLSGCTTGPSPYLPDTWVRQTNDIRTVGFAANQARLQVIVTYSGFLSSHTALRMVSNDGQVIFWDPAGDYGRFDDDWNAQYRAFSDAIVRESDLITVDPPDIATFVLWRWTLDDTSVEVFEWDLSSHMAASLANVLRFGTEDDHPAGAFSTWTFPMFCTMATSDFLGRFAGPLIELTQQYFLPHNLAEALYTQSPSRVRVFVPDGPVTIYAPPSATSVRQ